MSRYLLFILTLFVFSATKGQNPLPYYLPVGSYDARIPDPEKVLGFKPGEWHITHDQLVRYMFALAAASDRVQVIEYGRSHEMRPLFVLAISHPDNLGRMEEIKSARRDWWSGNTKVKADPSGLPGVLYQGYSVHGDESSGANASAIVAYHLAASRSAEVDRLLRENIILLDPCFNPDGLNRFANWVNQNRHAIDNMDDNSRELNQPWPGARTNHYWFDLNRDYIMAQHPETQGRVRLFREWMPEIFTDHHEMGSNNTLFFQPGIPSRVHPLTPAKNQELTGKIAEYHALFLNSQKSLYYTGESYDDFFYGKGSTYPDVNGSIGILFEQASSRGHLRQTENGPLSFAFTIKNQVTTSLSTQQAMLELREELLKFKRDFFTGAVDQGKADRHTGILTGSRDDEGRNRELLRVLLLHDIEVFRSGDTDLPFFIPMAQPNYYLIRSLFEERTSFQDSLFYDISAWNLPHALGIPFRYTDKAGVKNNGKRIKELPEVKGQFPEKEAAYAYLIPWEDYYAPAALATLVAGNIRVKFAKQAFAIETDRGRKEFQPGTLMIPMQQLNIHPKNLYGILKRISEDNGTRVYAVETGMTSEGPDLGSNSFDPVNKPVIGILTGSGTNSYEAGSIWFLLEKRYGTAVTMVDPGRTEPRHLDRYTHLIAPGGMPQELKGTNSPIKDWVNRGGTLIAIGDALGDLSSTGLPGLAEKSSNKTMDKDEWVPFDQQSDRSGARRISGSIFRIKMDRSHPLCFGFETETLPVFRRGTRFYDALVGSNTPARFAGDFLVAGYIPANLGDLPSGASYISEKRSGRGKVILFSDSPNFRSYFWGTNRFLANSLYFSNGF